MRSIANGSALQRFAAHRIDVGNEQFILFACLASRVRSHAPSHQWPPRLADVGNERLILFPSVAPLRPRLSTGDTRLRGRFLARRDNTACRRLRLCAPLRDGTYCRHVLRTPFPPMNVLFSVRVLRPCVCVIPRLAQSYRLLERTAFGSPKACDSIVFCGDARHRRATAYGCIAPRTHISRDPIHI